MTTHARLIRRQRRTQRKAAQLRWERAKRNAWGRDANRAKRRRLRAAKPEADIRRQAIIATMSSHERNLWARAGYPADEATFNRFAAKAVERMGTRRAA